MKKEAKLIFIIIATAIISCQSRRSALSPGEYAYYLQEPKHELCRKIEAGNIVYDIQLATPAYMACKDFGGLTTATPEFNARVKELKNCIFFLISIAAKDPNKMLPNSDQMALYYSGSVSSDIVLHVGKRDITPAVCHFENNLGLSPKNTLIVGFVLGDTITEDMQFVLNDRYSGNPLIQAAFSQKAINSIPALAI